MSDPVTNAEVEDVLSSIRRLVSDDIKPNRASRAMDSVETEATATEEPEPERLVLTPALRVEDAPETSRSQYVQEDNVEAQDVASEVAAEDKVDDHADVADPAYVSAEEPQPEITAPDEEVLADTSHDSNEDSARSVQFKATERKAYHFLDHLRKDARGFSATDAADDDEIREDALDAAASDQPEPFVVSDGVSTANEMDEEQSASVRDQEIDADPEPPVVFKRSSAQELTAKIAALEKVIARTPDQWEPDGAGEDDYAGTAVETLQWEDSVDLDGSGNPIRDAEPEASEAAREVEPQDIEVGDVDGDTVQIDSVVVEHNDTPEDPLLQAEEDSADVFAADEAVLDEEALRELVGDIVRQELQGGLGERITRNVRKLVRREIQRALTEQNLD